MTELRSGMALFDVEQPGATREDIALFSAATEDPNPIHVDADFAKACGFPQVIQQGPMTTAHFARLLKDAVGSKRMKSLDVTFTAPVFPNEPLRLTGTVARVGQDAEIELVARKADGTVTAKGTAILAVGSAR